MSNKRKYVMAAAGTAMLMLLGTFYAWSLFRVYLTGVFPGWGSAALSMNFTIFVVVFCIGSLFSGRFGGKLGSHVIIRLSALFIALGMLGVGLMEGLSESGALAVLYLCYGGVCGFAAGMAYNTILSGVSKWFPSRPGFISGLLLMGYGLGSLICGSAISALADKIGFFSAFIAADAVIALAIFFGAALFRQAPPAAGTQSKTGGETGVATAVMAKTPTFWLLFCWGLFTGCVGLMIINSAAPIAQSFGVLAALGLLVSLFNGFGRILSGLAYDALKGKSTYAVTAAAFCSGLLLVAAYFSGSVPLMFAGTLTAGMSYGAAMAAIAALMRDFFGLKHYASNLSVITLAGIPSSFMGPYVSGVLQDASGGFLTTFYAMLVFASLGLVCAIGISLAKKWLPKF